MFLFFAKTILNKSIKEIDPKLIMLCHQIRPNVPLTRSSSAEPDPWWQLRRRWSSHCTDSSLWTPATQTPTWRGNRPSRWCWAGGWIPCKQRKVDPNDNNQQAFPHQRQMIEDCNYCAGNQLVIKTSWSSQGERNELGSLLSFLTASSFNAHFNACFNACSQKGKKCLHAHSPIQESLSNPLPGMYTHFFH